MRESAGTASSSECEIALFLQIDADTTGGANPGGRVALHGCPALSRKRADLACTHCMAALDCTKAAAALAGHLAHRPGWTGCAGDSQVVQAATDRVAAGADCSGRSDPSA